MVLRRPVRLADDDGFSLTETLVAIGIAVIALLSLLATSVYAVRTSVESRRNQQAGDLLNRSMEEARSLEYGALRMVASEVAAAADPLVTGTPPRFDPDPSTAGTDEPLDVGAVGLISPYRQTTTTPSGDYTVARYVTVPASAVYNSQTPPVPSIRRLTVVVSWTLYGITHTRRAGTIVTNTRRGLPQPYYKFTYNGPATLVSGVPTWTKNPGNALHYGFVLRNLGASDSWRISSTTTAAIAPTWAYYRDTDKDGLWSGDVMVEPPLPASPIVPSDKSTGTLAAGAEPFYLVAFRTIGLAETGTTSTVFSATSEAQPTFPDKDVTTSLTVTPTVVTPTASASASPTSNTCTPGSNATVNPGTPVLTGARPNNSYTMTSLSLYNGPNEGNTTTQTSNSMGTDTSALQALICNYSTDQQSAAGGRLVTNSGVAPFGVAEWRFQPVSNSQDKAAGTVAINVWVQCAGSAPVLTLELGSLTGSAATYTSRGTGSTVVSSCPASGFSMVELTATYTNPVDLQTNLGEQLTFRVKTTQPVRLMYGTTSAAARVVVPLS